MRLFPVCQMGGFVLNKIFPHRRDRLILLPVIGSQLIVTISLFLLPVLIGTLEAYAGFTGRAAGSLLSMELAVSALTTLLLSQTTPPSEMLEVLRKLRVPWPITTCGP